MFSELCRETLRKAAVCYSAGRTGSPSPSPPTSPPPSPSKEAKAPANPPLANVNGTDHQIGESSCYQATSTTSEREVPYAKSNPTENTERRIAMLTDFSRRSRAGRCRVLCADTIRRYRRDSSSSSTEPDDSSTSGDEAGAAPEENNQRSSSAHNRNSLTKGRDSTCSAKDFDRAKLVRDRQNEERQRKLEELKQQALSAQRFREQRDEERRRRIDELKSRDSDRRNQVEERKRLIYEAERDRREAILRRNQEREARIEAKKKNERSHIVFAFGSSTPRMLEPADTGGSSFWGARRATSTTNVMMFPSGQPLTRRSSERELDGSKKRATSAGGLDRKPGEGDDSDGAAGTPASIYLRVNRRRTDLMPTIPSPRDGQLMSSRSSSAKAFTRSPGIRSGEVTPNSPSRPHSSMSQQSGSSVASSNVNLRPRTSTPRRPRPASIAGTGVTVSDRHNLSSDAKTKDSKPPLPKVHNTPKKGSTPRSANPSEATKKPGDRLIKSARASPRITPKVTPLQSPGAEQMPLIRQNTTEIISSDNKEAQSLEERQEEKKDQGSEKICMTESKASEKFVDFEEEDEKMEVVGVVEVADVSDNVEAVEVPETVDMTASMMAKIRITTEEEAKAALAERRRLAREQAEREAELERLRLLEQQRLEDEQLRAEEEAQRCLEMETLRLANEAREAEEQRLALAIEDAQKREEEDRKRREEELKQKLEKEEAERKAREEAEKQQIINAERLKKEEEERIARRKRVEAIMKRTRGGNNQANTPTKGDGENDKSKDESPSEEVKEVPGKEDDSVMTASLISEATQQLISMEQQDLRGQNDSSPTNRVRNGTHSNGINENSKTPENNQGELNGHHTNHGNGISQSITLDNATVKQNNVTNNLLDLSEFDTLTNSSPILELSSNLANEDSLNSNLNPAANPFTPMGNPFAPANANTNPFQDAFTKAQDNQGQVPDLLS